MDVPMKSSFGAVAEIGTFGHELPQRSREVFDGHSKRWSRVTRLCKVAPNRIFWQGFLSLVDLVVVRGKVSILGGLLNRSKATIVSSETYHFYSMINFFGSVVLFLVSQTQSTVSIRWKNEQKHWQCSWETLWPTKEKKEETCSVTCDFSVTR